MKPHFHIEGYAPRLALKHRYKATRKWPISAFFSSVGLTLSIHWGGGVQGRETGRKGGGRERYAREEGARSVIPKVAGSGRKREKLRNVAQYFAIEKIQRGGSQQIQSGKRDYRKREV